MASIVLTLACVGLVLYRIYKYMFSKPDNFPPGPPRIPFLGSYPFMLLLNYKHLHLSIDWLCRYYDTDVLGMYCGGVPTVVANSHDSVRAILNNTDLDGKPALLLAKLRHSDFNIRGIFFTEGPVWHEQRRFTLRYLRDFGFGRRFDELEIDINDEITNFISMLKNGPKYEHEKKYMKSGNILCPTIFAAVFGNSFFKVLLNDRLPREKQYILYEASEISLVFLKKGDAWGRIFGYLNWVAKVFSETTDYRVLRATTERFNECIKEIVDEQYRTFDPSHERHFLDMYFKKMEETKSNANTSFDYEQLLSTCIDFFLPSLNAISVTLQFLLHRFLLQPEILKKCQDEIDQVVGQGRLPSLNDRINLPYVEATLRESMRHETLVPNGLPHSALVDTKFMGYDIPKGSFIYSSLHACHQDERVFKNANEFKPERFLTDDGKFAVKLDKSLPFGAGKRLCAGETFARNAYFLVTTALIQNFVFKVPANEKMPGVDETITGVLRKLPDYWLHVESR